MASIVVRRTKKGLPRYRVVWYRDGQQCWSPTLESAEGADELKSLVERLGPDEALKILHRRSGRDVDDVPLLRDWFEEHLAQLRGHATPGTIDGYRSLAANTWLPRLGALPLDAISRRAVQAWVGWQREQTTRYGRPYAPKSIRNAHGLLSDTLKSAVDAELIPANVARGVPLPDDEVDREMEIFTEDEWARFIDAMDPHYRPLTRFLLVTGVRIGEATAVQVRDLDPVRHTVRIRRAWKKGERDSRYLGAPKSRRGVRTIVLSRAVSAELQELCAGKAAGDLVFTGPRGARIQAQHYRNRQWQRALEAAGITKDISPHGLRHTSASWLLGRGVSPIVVQHRLGHESLSTTSKVYAHLLTDAQLEAVDVMEAATARRAIEA